MIINIFLLIGYFFIYLVNIYLIKEES